MDAYSTESADLSNFGKAPILIAASSDCGVTATELKQARAEFRRGVALKARGKNEEALDSFIAAAQRQKRHHA